MFILPVFRRCSNNAVLLKISSAEIVNSVVLVLTFCKPIQYNTNTIQYNTIQYNTIQYNTIQYNTIIKLTSFLDYCIRNSLETVIDLFDFLSFFNRRKRIKKMIWKIWTRNSRSLRTESTRKSSSKCFLFFFFFFSFYHQCFIKQRSDKRS